MSHFSVLVVGPRTRAQLVAALQPFHEFECTGDDDQYVQEIDETEAARAEYQTYDMRRVRLADGTLVNPYDGDGYNKLFLREPTELELARRKSKNLFDRDRDVGLDWVQQYGRSMIFELPPGAQDVRVPAPTVTTFSEFVEYYYSAPAIRSMTEIDRDDAHKYGWILLDARGEVVKVVRRTNPNRKWDWWEVGGRWQNMILLKPNARPVNMKDGAQVSKAQQFEALVGLTVLEALPEDGVLSEGVTVPRPVDGRCDAARVGDIDFALMRHRYAMDAGEHYDQIMAALGGQPLPVDFEEIRKAYPDDLEAARTAYQAQPGFEAIRKLIGWDGDPSDYACSRAEYCQRQRDSGFTAFAYLKDGEWHERGRMGMFATVSNEQSEADWHREFNAMLDGLASDTVVSIVDCHV